MQEIGKKSFLNGYFLNQTQGKINFGGKHEFFNSKLKIIKVEKFREEIKKIEGEEIKLQLFNLNNEFNLNQKDLLMKNFSNHIKKEGEFIKKIKREINIGKKIFIVFKIENKILKLFFPFSAKNNLGKFFPFFKTKILKSNFQKFNFFIINGFKLIFFNKIQEKYITLKNIKSKQLNEDFKICYINFDEK